MFTNVLSSLTSLVPKNFIFGSYVPVLIFSFVNIALLCLNVSVVRAFFLAQVTAPSAFNVAATFVATIVLAYVLSSIADFLREILEGKHFLPRRLRDWMVRREDEKYQELFKAATAASERAELLSTQWQQVLKQSLATALPLGAKLTDPAAGLAQQSPDGKEAGEVAARPAPEPEVTKLTRSEGQQLALEIRRQAAALSAKLRHANVGNRLDADDLGHKLDANDVKQAVEALVSGLSAIPGLPDDSLIADYSDSIHALRSTLWLIPSIPGRLLPDYSESIEILNAYFADHPLAYAKAYSEQIDALHGLQTRFGTVPVEPTSMGNVASSLNYYASSRYGLDLVTFWSRLQLILQKNDDKDYSGLLDAKTQLDFLVACCCLCALSAAAWFVALGALGNSLAIFLLVAVAGPSLSFLLYELAVENYISYGVIVRASVDIHRFSLLESLHIALPSSLREEQNIWMKLQQASGFGYSAMEIGYEHPDTK